jgi:hypothetical protein
LWTAGRRAGNLKSLMRALSALLLVVLGATSPAWGGGDPPPEPKSEPKAELDADLEVDLSR